MTQPQYKIVPVEPTDDMVNAGVSAMGPIAGDWAPTWKGTIASVYRRAASAAPSQDDLMVVRLRWVARDYGGCALYVGTALVGYVAPDFFWQTRTSDQPRGGICKTEDEAKSALLQAVREALEAGV